MTARWEASPVERRAVLESRNPALTLALVIVLVALLGALVAAL